MAEKAEMPKENENSNPSRACLVVGLTQFDPIRASFSADFDRSEGQELAAKLFGKPRVSAWPGRLLIAMVPAR